jgi:hypothetical protein
MNDQPPRAHVEALEADIRKWDNIRAAYLLGLRIGTPIEAPAVRRRAFAAKNVIDALRAYRHAIDD